MRVFFSSSFLKCPCVMKQWFMSVINENQCTQVIIREFSIYACISMKTREVSLKMFILPSTFFMQNSLAFCQLLRHELLGSSQNCHELMHSHLSMLRILTRTLGIWSMTRTANTERLFFPMSCCSKGQSISLFYQPILGF